MSPLRGNEILFNIYIADIPPSISRQFVYADGSAVGVSSTFDSVERILEADLATLSNYFHLVPSRLSESKTVFVFQLAHRLVNFSITIMHKGSKLKFNHEPVYHGVTWNAVSHLSLIYRPLLRNQGKE